MFGIFKKFLGQPDNNQLGDAIKNGAFLVDVRTPAEFAGGSVKGAVNIPLDKLRSNLDRFKGKASIVVFCQSGNRSGQAQTILQQNGIQNVINGGSWSNVNRLVSKP